jgi:hypothetical protein
MDGMTVSPDWTFPVRMDDTPIAPHRDGTTVSLDWTLPASTTNTALAPDMADTAASPAAMKREDRTTAPGSE